MIINNVFKLFEKEEAASSPPPVKAPSEVKTEAENIKDKVRCRFCNELYSAEYYGCPYCKNK
jgi:hypothetical protein